MATVTTAKAFRQQVLKPADGLFLFHARAIERLIEEQLGERLQGVSIPDLPYYLMPKDDFLYGLETENAEALSVIEGLRLPNYVILLPSPPEQRLEARGLRLLRHGYWARGFEAEVARAWQNAREDNRDLDLFGARGLRALIGEHAFREVRDGLHRDGVTLPIWEDDLICRSFVAMVVRLRYFGPGARGFFFPAVQVWSEVDRWLNASGLDVPEPLQNNRLPILLVRSRPGAGGELPDEPPLLPTALPFGASDPDLPRALAAAMRASAQDSPPSTQPEAEPEGTLQANSVSGPEGDLARRLEKRCLAALRQGSSIRRRGWAGRLREALDATALRVLRQLLFLPGLDQISLGQSRMPRGRGRDLGLALFQQGIAAAQRAELEGRFARALRRLAEARRLAVRLHPAGRGVPTTVEQAIAEREGNAEEHFADLLAAKWKLGPDSAEQLRDLIGHLAAEARRRFGWSPAQALLANLEQVLSESRGDYFQLHFGRWLLTLGGRPIRQVLPFQSLLKALRALQTARIQLEELPWPIADLERFGDALAALTEQVNKRLDAQVMPRVEQAMREADFVPRNHRENVAAQKMKLELMDVIKRRRHLKFTDVRDIVARNVLRLPDPTLTEFFRGDRLHRFDRTASRALPGVYRPGELYIKALQQLGAPLFGTGPGRGVLRHLLLPFGAAFLLVKTLDLLIALIPHGYPGFHLTDPVAVILIAGAINVGFYTGIGRHLALVLWHGTLAALRFILYEGLRQLLRWEPLARLLKTGFMRGLGRHVVQPLLIGILPLMPIMAIAVFVEDVPIRPGLWLFGLAFALGTLARNTPAGRRFLDNLSTDVFLYLKRVNQALFVDLIQQLSYLFKELTRRFAQLLHRVDEALTHHLGERPISLMLKAVLAPLWRLAEAVIEFYVTVLVEPQVNPVKHFPIVSIGHKVLLPFLPAITAAFVDISASVLPKVIAYPLVTVTIMLLPGLFGFLVWELKENWKLYQANHVLGLRGADLDPERCAPIQVEPAVVGSHGETMRGLMTRGFHGGALPKGFDRLRRVIRDEMQDQVPYQRRLLRVQRHLEEVRLTVCVFFEREFTFALRERCRDPGCTLTRVETGTPRIATNLVELQADIHLAGSAGVPESPTKPVRICIRISQRDRRIHFETDIAGEAKQIGPYCWSLIEEDLRLFAGRAGADVRTLKLPELVTIPSG